MLRSILFLIILISVIPNAHSQFLSEQGKPVSECDCNKPIRYLDFMINLPANYKSYDIIQIVAYRNGSAVSFANYRASQIPQTLKVNLLNYNNKALRTLLGKEYGRFRGNDLKGISYSSMCEYLIKMSKLSIKVFGVKQVGTETTYEIQSDRKTIKAKTVPVYDGGEELVKSTEILFKK